MAPLKIIFTKTSHWKIKSTLNLEFITESLQLLIK